MNSVKIGVAAYNMPGSAILPFTISVKPGRGQIEFENIDSISAVMKSSVAHVLTVCEKLTKKRLNPNVDLVIRSEQALETVVGPSWELPLSLAIISLFTGRPLKPGLSATGALVEGNYFGLLAPIGGLAEKTDAAKRAGVSTFIVPGSQPRKDFEGWSSEGIKIYAVTDVSEAATLAFGIPLSRFVI